MPTKTQKMTNIILFLASRVKVEDLRNIRAELNSCSTELFEDKCRYYIELYSNKINVA